MGERLNGIQEVRGSIPLTSMVARSMGCQAPEGRRVRRGSGCPDAGIAQLVEHNLAKVGVAGSSPVSRSFRSLKARRMDGCGRCRVHIGRLAQLVRAPR